MVCKKLINRVPALIIGAFIYLSSFFQSCDFLDIDPYIHDLFTVDTLFANKEYTQQYLNNIYSYLVDYGAISGTNKNAQPWTLMSDEGRAGYKGFNKKYYMYNYYCNNEVKPEDQGVLDRWDYFYEGIRKANTFIERVNECQEATVMQRSEWIGEAKFIKAMLYFELMLAYGPIPIVPDEVVDFDTPIDQLMVERSTWDECSKYVSNLLEEAIKLLPNEVRDDAEVGKPIKLSALAVLSRLSLYTASPLYNGSNAEFASFTNNAGVPYLNPTYNEEKWAIAAANAKRIVEQKPNDLYTVPRMSNTPELPVPEHEKGDFPNGVGGIDPYHSYSDMFTGECVLASTNKEILFCQQGSNIEHTGLYTAPLIIDGYNVFFITQSLVDAYYMADGRSIEDASEEYPYENGYTDNEIVFSGEKDSNGFTILSGTHRWYVNREMRFYATVSYCNSYYPSTSTPTNLIDQRDGKVAKYYSDSKSGRDYAMTRPKGNAEEYPMTGYGCRKYIHYEDSYFNGGRRKRKYAIAYRMAEVYLNYVEAMNELTTSYVVDEVTVSRDADEMKRCFNLIRYRAGLPGITDADVADVERMRELIARERQIELAWEGRRYHDLRRTKKAVIYENAPVKGCNVSATEAEKDKFYSIIQVKERNYFYSVFTNRQTFLPIPKVEVDKNYNLDQMPGY